MASTGCGKTIANAKIMRALSEKQRKSTLHSSSGFAYLDLANRCDEYRHRIGLNNDELAVLIGSSAIKELHERVQAKSGEQPSFEDSGSESLEALLDEDLGLCWRAHCRISRCDYSKTQPQAGRQNKAFLYKPVLACTIDHIIAATETTRGGKYILPSLRLLSSDLVIDEVDDFDGKDLIAIGRLIHLAGMLGRKVMISQRPFHLH